MKTSEESLIQHGYASTMAPVKDNKEGYNQRGSAWVSMGLSANRRFADGLITKSGSAWI